MLKIKLITKTSANKRKKEVKTYKKRWYELCITWKRNKRDTKT